MKVDNGKDPLDSRFAAFASLLTTEKLTAGVTHGPLRFLHGFGNVLMINSTMFEGFILVDIFFETKMVGRLEDLV